MQTVAIVTDSAACLPAGLAKAHGITTVPFSLSFGDREYLDGVDDPADFYRQLRAAKRLPTTAAPPPATFLGALRDAAGLAESVLAITLPANLSSAHESCRQAVGEAAVEMPGTQFRAMEAGAVAAGQGLIVLEAARAAMRGASLDEVESRARELAGEVHFFAFLDTLDYLAKGGHVPKAAAWLGGLVGLRPILTAPHGDVRRITQARSRRGAMERIVRLAARANPEGVPLQIMVMHADAPADAAALRDALEARFPCPEVQVTQFTPVMGSHSGPGVVGVALRKLASRATSVLPVLS